MRCSSSCYNRFIFKNHGENIEKKLMKKLTLNWMKNWIDSNNETIFCVTERGCRITKVYTCVKQGQTAHRSVLILDGNSEICAPVWSDLDYLISAIESCHRSDFFLQRHVSLHMCATRVELPSDISTIPAGPLFWISVILFQISPVCSFVPKMFF